MSKSVRIYLIFWCMSLSKKSLILTALIVFLFCRAEAQKFSFGAKAGALVSWCSFADPDDSKEFSSLPKAGFLVEGLINFPMKSNYSFQAEGGFSQHGRRVSYANGTWENNSTYYFGNLSMILRRSFQLHVLKNVPTNWFVNVGPSINYWLSGRGNIIVEYGVTQPYSMIFNKPSDLSYDKMFVNDANRWLFGLSGGIGFDATTLRNQKIVTELRVSFAKTYLGNKNSTAINVLGFEDSLKANLLTINLSVAYVFDKDIKESKMGKSNKDKVVNRKKTKKK